MRLDLRKRFRDGCDVVESQNGKNAGRRSRCVGIDLFYVRACVWAAKHYGVREVRQFYVRGVSAFAAQESLIFVAADRGADDLRWRRRRLNFFLL